MASHPPPPSSPVIQIVKRGEGKEVFHTKYLQKLIDDHSSEGSKLQYAVVSIIGAQSSGKSTLMNNLFGTQFEMMDLSKGWNTTTEGIWAAVCQGPRAIVLDVEGADGKNHQDDAGFENQTGVFALTVSDVIFFNIKAENIGLMQAGSIPLLQTIFQERPRDKNDRTKTKFVVAIRDCSSQTPESVLRKQVLSTLDEILDESNNKEYFETSVECFPHFEYNLGAFQRKCQDIIAQPEFFHKRKNINWPIDEFPILAEKLWTSILKNEKLDMPSHWAMISRERCEAVKVKKLLFLESHQVYQSLTNGRLHTPVTTFHTTLQGILEIILQEYSEDTKYFHKKWANEVKDALTTEIIQNSEGAFIKALEEFTSEFVSRAIEEIEIAMKENLFENMEKTVIKHSENFQAETQGLDLYCDIVKQRQQDVQENLKGLTKSIRNRAVVNFVSRTSVKIFYIAGRLVLGMEGANLLGN